MWKMENMLLTIWTDHPIDGEIEECGSHNNPRTVGGSNDRCSRADREDEGKDERGISTAA